MTDSSGNAGLKKMHGSKIGPNSTIRINVDGQPSLARSSKHPEAKLRVCARAAYGSLMMGLTDFDRASPKLQAKSLQIAQAVLDAADLFKTSIGGKSHVQAQAKVSEPSPQ